MNIFVLTFNKISSEASVLLRNLKYNFKSYNDAQETVNGAFSLCGWSMKQHN